MQGVLEQVATLAVLGGYPGSILFGAFVSDSAPVYWPGAAYALAAVFSLSAASVFYVQIFKLSDGVDKFPYASMRQNSEVDDDIGVKLS